METPLSTAPVVDEYNRETTLPYELERRADDVLYTERMRDWGKAGERRWGKGLRGRARSIYTVHRGGGTMETVS